MASNHLNNYDSSSSEESEPEDSRLPRDPLSSSLDSVLQALNRKRGNGEARLFDPESREARALLTAPAGDKTVWHLLAKKDNLPKPSRLKKLLQFLVQESPDLLFQLNGQEESALYDAIVFSNNRLIELICDIYSSRNSVKFDDLLRKSHNRTPCLHYAMKYGIKALSEMVDLASPETLIAKDDNGNTALHLAVEFPSCSRDRVQLVKKIIDKCDHLMRKNNTEFNKFGNSPYRHHFQTKTFPNPDQDRNRRIPELRVSKGSPAQIEKRLDYPKELGQEASPENSKETPKKLLPPGPRDPQLSHYRTLTFQIMEDPTKNDIFQDEQVRTDREPWVQSSVPALSTSPEGSQQINNENPGSLSVDRTFFAKQVESYLRHHYLRTRGNKAASKILYEMKITGGRHFMVPKPKMTCFDLSYNASMSYKSIERTAGTMELETILQMVYIPRLERPTAAANSSRRGRGTPSRETRDQTDIEKVFNTLLKDVTTIFKVTVEDLIDPIHTDEVIEKCLKNKNVEIWDWKKLDICPGLILRTAPKLRELHLYWSGRNAVLRGWGDEMGLCRLKQLETITVHVEQVPEPMAYTKENFRKFKTCLLRQFWGEITEGIANAKLGDVRERVESTFEKYVSRAFKDKQETELYGVMQKHGHGFTNHLTATIAAEITQQLNQIVEGRINENEAQPPLEAGTLTSKSDKLLSRLMSKLIQSIKDQAASFSDHVNTEQNVIRISQDLTQIYMPQIKAIASEIAIQESSILKEIKIEADFPDKPVDSINGQVKSNLDSSPKEPQSHMWITCMENFSTTLYQLDDRQLRPAEIDSNWPVRVALIDDGIKLEHLTMQSLGPITGCSFFYTQLGDPNWTREYYHTSRGHGTTMALQIYRICPKARLHVIKLQDHKSPDGETTSITPKSAAEAINHAVDCKVDIISMSWTIDVPKDEETADLMLLEAAINRAVTEKIPMFCSARDMGADNPNTYPSKVSERIFRIGGANIYGHANDAVGSKDNVHYTCPGNLVATEALAPDATLTKNFFTGSSVATALAAGLAALIIYCAQVRVAASKDDERREEAVRCLNKLKTQEGMKKALDIISKGGKYLQVWDIFDQTSKRDLTALQSVVNIAMRLSVEYNLVLRRTHKVGYSGVA